MALLVRLPRLGWGLPLVEEEALPMKKAFAMWGWETGRIDWNPHTAGWPSLSFDLHLLAQHVHYAVGRLLGAFHDRGDYFVAYWLDPGPLLLVSRGVSVIAAALTVGVATRIANRLGGRAAGLAAGGLLALSPLFVEQSQLVTPDILATLFATLAIERIVCLALLDRGSDDLWTGLWIGLGVSSKYTPALLIPGWIATHLLWRDRASWNRLAIGLGLAGLAFAVTSPFLLLDPATLGRDVSGQLLHLTRGHFGGAPGRPSLTRYLTDVLGPGLGWSGLLLGLFGLAWGMARGGIGWRALAACALPYYFALALLRTQFSRYALPLLPPIAVGMGGGVAAIGSLSIDARAKRVATALLVAVAWAPAAVGTWRYLDERGRPSTQALADQFVREIRLDHPPHVAAEVLALSLPTARAAAMASESPLLSPAQRERMLSRSTYDIDYLPMYTVQPEMAHVYYDIRHFTAHDLVAVTDAVRGRYLADSSRFAPELRFYRDLDRFAVLAARFAPGSRARGPEVRIYRIPDTAWVRIDREVGLAPLPRVDARSPIHGPDYLEFVEGVARAAYAKGRWAMAAHYYEAMLQAGEAGWMPEIERLPLMRMLAGLEERAGAPDRAARLYRAYLERVPGDSPARAELERLVAAESRPRRGR